MSTSTNTNTNTTTARTRLGDACPGCEGHVHQVADDDTIWLECSHGCGWTSHPAGLLSEQRGLDFDAQPLELEHDPAVREAERDYRVNSYLRNENAVLAKWAAGELTAHPYADLFPMMTGDEHARLVASIEANGYDREDEIILFGGRILDGRNRGAAAREVWRRHKDDADAERYQPRFKEFLGSDLAALGYVKRHGLDRRHLGPSQVALIGSELHDRLIELRQKLKAQGPTAGRSDYDDEGYDDEFGDVGEIGGRSAAYVAGLTGASERSVERMNRIRSPATKALLGAERHHEILEAIRKETMTARAAEDEIKAAKLAAAAKVAEAAAREAAKAAGNKLASDAEPWPGTTLLAAHGRRIVRVDALELLDAVEPHTAATIVLDPPPVSPDLGRWEVENRWEKMLHKVARALAPGGDVWLIADAASLGAALEVLGAGEWAQRAVLAWDDSGPLTSAWAAAPKFLVWVTARGDQAPRDLDGVVAALGRGPLLAVGPVATAEIEHGRHPQQRPEALYDGLLAMGTGLVVAPYCGTGAAAVAAVRGGRPVVAGDIVEQHLRAAVLRVEKAASKKAASNKAASKKASTKKASTKKASTKKASTKKKAPPKKAPKKAASKKKASTKKA